MSQEQNLMNDLPLPKYTLDAEQEKKEILRNYRSLLKGLRPKLKKGDKEMVRTAFEMSADAHKTMRRKSGNLIFYTHSCSNDLCRRNWLRRT
jgi:GTP pyrophosphokinase